jgi:cysteine synthase
MKVLIQSQQARFRKGLGLAQTSTAGGNWATCGGNRGLAEAPLCRKGRYALPVHMINLGSHKGKAVRRLIRAAGAKLIFLPKYSPDLNPIEQVFAKLKHLLRKIAARTADDVCAAIGQILGAFAPDECANYFRNSGYALT